MRVGIVGLGYVGLPLAVAFTAADVDVVGVDLDMRKIDALAAARPRLEVTPDYRALAGVDAILICVPTPLTANREPDLEPLLGCARELGAIVRAGQLVVLESTTYPGTTRERVVPG